MFVRSYLRASTIEQDANRASTALEQLATEHGQLIANMYTENASGTEANRPELLRLLKDARKGDVLLVESIDRLSRMEDPEWRMLQATIDSKGLRIVALDLPTSHLALRVSQGDEFTSRMLGAINNMMIEMMAGIARKDYQQRVSDKLRELQRPKAPEPTKVDLLMPICTSCTGTPIPQLRHPGNRPPRRLLNNDGSQNPRPDSTSQIAEAP